MPVELHATLPTTLADLRLYIPYDVLCGLGTLGVDGDRYRYIDRYVGIQWGPCGWLGEIIWDALTGITLDEYSYMYF